MTDRRTYAAEATSWALDTRRREARAARIAWVAATVAAGIAALEAVALVALTPLKTVQPITLLVDRQTGFVQALDPATPQLIGADAALTDAMLAQYVAAREAFDRATIAGEYRRVVLWSSGPARAGYLALMPASNPASPIQRYSKGTVVAARVKSVSSLGAGTALVRFDTREEDRTGREGVASPWISVVRYRYSAAAMSFEDRLVNPLGFQVVSYRRDAEAPMPADPPAHVPEAAPPAAYPAVATMRAAPAGRPSYPLHARRPPSVAWSIPDLSARGAIADQIPQGSPLIGRGVAPAAAVAR